VIFEDRKNPSLLFLGSDGGVFVSIDGGERWVRMKSSIPNSPVKDLLVHPRENDLVVATYGRGLFVTDITPLQEMNEKILEEDVHFFEIKPRMQRVTSGWGSYRLYGDRHLFTPNEPDAVAINYYLREKPKDKVKITVTDLDGQVLAELPGKPEPGMNTILWNTRLSPKKEEMEQREEGSRGGELVAPGEYRITLEVGQKKITHKAMIKGRIGWTIGPVPVLIR
jgi:hypothetical protein